MGYKRVLAQSRRGGLEQLVSAMLDLSSLRLSVESLEAALSVHRAQEAGAPGPPVMPPIVLAGTIKNFEFIYDLSVRMLRRHLDLDGELPLPIDQINFRDVLRIAGERGLIDDVEAWFQYRDLRNITAHTYKEQKAREAYAAIPRFLSDAKSLLANLEARNVG